MSLLDMYQSSKLGLMENHGVEPSQGTPAWGFYSKIYDQSADALSNDINFSKLHREYSLNADPDDLDIVAFNPDAHIGLPWDSTLDPLDYGSPKNTTGIATYNEGGTYRNLGPSEGRY